MSPEPPPSSDAGRPDAGRPDAGRPGDADADPSADPDASPDPDVAQAASSALARARRAARDKGLRPGLRPVRRRRPSAGEQVRSGSSRDGRDPATLGDQLDRLLSDRGWQVDVAAGAVMSRWPQIVGPEIAEHVTPTEFRDGALVLRADSTAWATQLRLLSSQLLGRIAEEVGPDTVLEITVHGPSAPSWSRGIRRAKGPGPRDTYG